MNLIFTQEFTRITFNFNFGFGKIAAEGVDPLFVT